MGTGNLGSKLYHILPTVPSPQKSNDCRGFLFYKGMSKSEPLSMREQNATGRLFWDKLAAIANSNESTSTWWGIDSSIEQTTEFSISHLSKLKTINASPTVWNSVLCVNGLIFVKTFLIHLIGINTFAHCLPVLPEYLISAQVGKHMQLHIGIFSTVSVNVRNELARLKC